MSHARRLAVVLSCLLMPAAAQAQHGRMEEDRTLREQVQGLTAAQTRQLIDAVSRIENVLRSNSAVRTPPPGVCTRLSTFMPEHVSGDRATMTLSVQLPIRFENGVCHDISNTGIAITLNDERALFPGSRLDDAATAMYVLPLRVSGEGRVVEYRDNYNRYLVVTRAGADLLVPLTTEQFLRERIRQVETARADVTSVPVDDPFPDVERWRRDEKPQMQREFEATMREMQGHVSDAELQRMRQNFEQVLAATEEALRAAARQHPRADSLRSSATRTTGAELDRLRAALHRLDPRARVAPACLAADRPLDLGPCTEHNRLVRINPDYFAADASPAAVQLLVVAAPLNVTEDARHTQLRRQMFDLLDRTALQTVLMH